MEGLNAALVARRLRGLWEAMFDRPPGELAEDLRVLDSFFGAGANKGLRERVMSVRPAEEGPELQGLVIAVGDRVLVTPEGRVVLERLSNHPVSADVAREQERVLLEFYRGAALVPVKRLAQRWTTPTSPMAMPVALLVLINGSVDAERALIADPKAERAIKEALRRPVVAFAKKVAKTNRGHSQTIDGYPSEQAARVLRPLMHRERRRGQAVRLWIPSSDIAAAIQRIAEQVVRVQETPPELAIEALGDLLRSYEEERGTLAQQGLAFSSAPERKRLRSRIARALTARKS
jgi:hypothetical protein